MLSRAMSDTGATMRRALACAGRVAASLPLSVGAASQFRTLRRSYVLILIGVVPECIRHLHKEASQILVYD
jgi:hypothetical protein